MWRRIQGSQKRQDLRQAELPSGNLCACPFCTRCYHYSCPALRNGLRFGMIRTIRHKGLKRLHEDDDPRGVIAEHADKLRDILARLDAILVAADMDVPGLRLHPLKGREKGFGAVTVRANGGSFSALLTMTPSMLITWTTTEKETELCR